MPRYYFHFTDGKQVLNNHKGIDLPGNAAAREDAVALTRDLKHGWWCCSSTGSVRIAGYRWSPTPPPRRRWSSARPAPGSR